jgi:hypothetical protein
MQDLKAMAMGMATARALLGQTSPTQPHVCLEASLFELNRPKKPFAPEGGRAQIKISGLGLPTLARAAHLFAKTGYFNSAR